MKNIINMYKPIGISPLDAIKLFQEKNPEYRDVSMTYAGRLDPMAEGVLILLAGNEVHKAKEYQKLDKGYEAEILFGFETDTHDILGMAQRAEPFKSEREDIEKEIKNLKGKISLPLPPYSSYKIKGPPSPRLRRTSKPLFMWAREGRLKEIEIPMRTTQVHKADTLDSYDIDSKELLKKITEKISLVKGDFRQEEIAKRWKEILNKDQKYHIVKVRFDVSSGTYIRSIANHIGGVLFSLKRTKVGKFDIENSKPAEA